MLGTQEFKQMQVPHPANRDSTARNDSATVPLLVIRRNADKVNQPAAVDKASETSVVKTATLSDEPAATDKVNQPAATDKASETSVVETATLRDEPAASTSLQREA